MSVMVTRALQNNLDFLKKALNGTKSGTEEESIKALKARLASEKDMFVKNAIEAMLKKMTNAKPRKKVSAYEEYREELTELMKHFEEALKIMHTIPFYMKSTKGRRSK